MIPEASGRRSAPLDASVDDPEEQSVCACPGPVVDGKLSLAKLLVATAMLVN